MKFFCLLVALIFVVLPMNATEVRRGIPVEPFNPHLGPFDWKVNYKERSDGTVRFHIVLAHDKKGWPDVRLDRHPSVGLSHVQHMGHKRSFEYVGEIHAIPFTVEGNSIVCDFSVKKAELNDPTFCFSFVLYSEEKTVGDFAVLNDFLDFPTAAIVRLGDKRALDRRAMAEKIARISTLAPDRTHRDKYVQSLRPYLNDDDDAVRGSMARAMGGLGTSAKPVVPILLAALDARAGARAFQQSQGLIAYALDRIEPAWRERPDVTEKIKREPCFFVPIDG